MSDAVRAYPNTYFVQGRLVENEPARLQIQDLFLNMGMGGVLPEQPDPSSFRQILDVGCGTGGWLIGLARQYPSISLLVGIDVNKHMLDFARTQVEGQQVSDRVQLQEMDALRSLDFSTSTFDLVNQRFGFSFLRKWEWQRLLNEYRRVCKPGGVIRIVELDLSLKSTSAALNSLLKMTVEAFYHAGHFFTSKGDGVTSQLAPLLEQTRLQNVQRRIYPLEYRTGTLEWQYFSEDMRSLFQTIVPFLRKWTRLTEDYEAIYEQALEEMQLPDFVATTSVVASWGNKPSKDQNK